MKQKRIQCPICLELYVLLTYHVNKKHQLSVDQFKAKYPSTPMFSDSHSSKCSKSRLRYYANRSENEAKSNWENLSAGQKRRWKNADPNDPKLISRNDKISKGRKAFFANMSDKEYESYCEHLVKIHEARFARMTKTEYEAFCKKRSEDQKAYFANMSEEKYKDFCNKRRMYYANMTEAELRAHMISALPGSTSQLELEVVDQLKKLGYKVKHKLKVGRYEIDTYLPQVDLAIEVYGDYWHGSTLIFKASDIHSHGKIPVSVIRARNRLRERTIRKLGYNLAIVWESDLYKYGFKEMLEWTIQENTVPRRNRKVA